MNIAICEDNESDALQIRTYIATYAERNCCDMNIHSFTNGEALLAAFCCGMYDIVFLDIYMPGMTGIQTAEKIRADDPYCALIFITVSRTHALEAFSVRAAGYVPKPIEPEAMEVALTQCRDLFIKNSRYIEVISDRQRLRIPLSKLIYAEVYGKDIIFYLEHTQIRASIPLEEIEKKLGGSPFLRCHRAYLINMNYVERFGEQDIRMKNGDSVPLRQRGRTKLRMAFGAFLSGRMLEVI